MDKKVNEVFETEEYSKFKKINNRKVTLNKKLEEEILKTGQLSPIVVNEQFGVIDGQHRLELLKKHGKPVQYIILKKSEARDVISMNSTSKIWNNTDYLEYFCCEGNENYLKIKFLLDKYNLMSIEVLLRIIGKNKVREDFRSGDLILDNEAILRIESISKSYHKIIEKTDVRNHQGFQRGFTQLLLLKDVDIERLISKINTVREANRYFNDSATESYRKLIDLNNKGLKINAKAYIDYVIDSKGKLIIKKGEEYEKSI